jgi:hypothetical protein
MRWVCHVEHIGKIRNSYNILVGKPQGRDHLEDLAIEDRIVLKLTLEKYGMKRWTGLN